MNIHPVIELSSRSLYIELFGRRLWAVVDKEVQPETSWKWTLGELHVSIGSLKVVYTPKDWRERREAAVCPR